jgi:hypothetical protein
MLACDGSLIPSASEDPARRGAFPAVGSPADFRPSGGDLGPMAWRGSVRSSGGMCGSDEALLDLSVTAAQARLASSRWFTNVRACVGIRLDRHVHRLQASMVTPDMAAGRRSSRPGRRGAAGDAAATRGAGPAVVAGAIARAVVAGQGGLPQSRKPGSGRPCVVWLPACPGVG